MSDKCVRHWVQWDDASIKEEIMAMSHLVVDHAKQGKEIGIEAPIEKAGHLIFDEFQEIEHMFMEQVQTEDGGISWLFVFWLICTAVCIIGIGGWFYRGKVDRVCSNLLLQYSDKDHIV